MLEEKVSFWTKSDVLDLVLEYGLLESQHDACLFSYAMSRDELLEFACFLFCYGWGSSRNFTVLDEETQQDERVRRMFDYLDGKNC